MPTYVVTGASSGIGLELVKQLAAREEKVFATCRSKASSMTGVDLISEVPGDVTVIEGVDVASDSVGSVLAASALAGVPIDVIIHNAGSVNGSRDVASGDIFPEQSLDRITMDRMRAAFEVNTLGPLRVQQALNSQMSSGGKVAIISTGIGSISDNGSGGKYAYRVSKAGVNMVAKSMSCDLRERGISVSAVAPGFVVTEFGPGSEAMASWGAKPVAQAGKGIIDTIDGMTMDNTGSFLVVSTSDGVVRTMPW